MEPSTPRWEVLDAVIQADPCLRNRIGRMGGDGRRRRGPAQPRAFVWMGPEQPLGIGSPLGAISMHGLRQSSPIGKKQSLSFFFFFSLTVRLASFWTSRVWSQVSSLFPPDYCLQFSSRIGFSNPTARRFSSSVANSRSRAFRKSICAQEKVSTNLYEYALGGARTHETDLYQARG